MGSGSAIRSIYGGLVKWNGLFTAHNLANLHHHHIINNPHQPDYHHIL